MYICGIWLEDKHCGDLLCITSVVPGNMCGTFCTCVCLCVCLSISFKQARINIVNRLRVCTYAAHVDSHLFLYHYLRGRAASFSGWHICSLAATQQICCVMLFAGGAGSCLPATVYPPPAALSQGSPGSSVPFWLLLSFSSPTSIPVFLKAPLLSVKFSVVISTSVDGPVRLCVTMTSCL